MNALPRPHCSDSSFSAFPKKGWVGSITLIVDITRSSLGVLCRARRRRGRHATARSAHAPRPSAQVRREELAPERLRRSSCQERPQRVIIPRSAAARWGILTRPRVGSLRWPPGPPGVTRAKRRRLGGAALWRVGCWRFARAPSAPAPLVSCSSGLAGSQAAVRMRNGAARASNDRGFAAGPTRGRDRIAFFSGSTKPRRRSA